MKFHITSFQWDNHNKIKSIKKHGITNEEAEEAFFDPQAHIRKVKGERYILLGRTYSGKYLLEVFVFVNKETIRIISSRPMTKAEKRLYQK